MSFQVPLQDTNVNVLIPMDLQMQLQNRQLHFASQQIAHRTDHRTDEKSYPTTWTRSLLPGVNVELQNRTLWEQFHAETTEMIITKSGRRMFPSIQLTVNGLNKQDYYYVVMEIAPASDRRHKYCGNSGGNDENTNKSNIGWSIAGSAEPQQPFLRRVFFHPDNPSTGEHWMQNSINFSKLKLTNNIVDHRNNVVLTSMHKYVPKIWIINCANTTNLIDLFSHPTSSFVFKETEFIAVTAYQNENITKLKINNNPFAKGFRETGQSRCKRKYRQISHASQVDDEEGNSSSDSSESNHSASSLDLTQKSKSESKNKNSDNCDDIKPLAGEERSLKLESNNESEVPSPFHRPWLDTSSNKRKPMVPISMMPPIPSLPVINNLRETFSVPYYLHMPFIAQQNLARCYQYDCPMFRSKRL
ncbi:T-box protein 2 [Camponotus floridanus]|uniref:T-box protein 2 n=3 Tax=Camponotus floridanus TaxID=104421 RepID=E1ZX98_CAMFO|nr:T-box protein 2 [Camponotus floridanus]